MKTIDSKPEKVLMILVILFFVIYSFLAINSNTTFNSPDENANYFFSRLFAEKNTLTYPINNLSDIVHPRSTTVVNNNIVPQSFLGLPIIYGLIAKIFSINIIIFLTPLITSITVLFFYQIIKKVFDDKVALISSLLFFIHPSVLYYTNRSMFHNMLFVDLLIIGFYFLSVIDEHTPPPPPARGGSAPHDSFMVPTLNDYSLISSFNNFPLISTNTNPSSISHSYKKNTMNVSPPRRSHVAIASGDGTGGWGGAHVYLTTTFSALFLSLALITRTSEAPWVLLILIILYLFNRKNPSTSSGCKINYKQLILGAVICIVVFLPILFLNNKLYGSPFSSGYKIINSTTNALPTLNLVPIGKRQLIKNIIDNWWNYQVMFFWWLSVPAFLVLIYLFKNYKSLNKNQKQYLILFLTSAVFLTAYYGSWMFHDNPDPNKITIGTSYVRYWLPIYIFSLPFVAIFLTQSWPLIKVQLPNLRLKLYQLFFTSFIVVYSLTFTFYTAKDESLWQKDLKLYSKIKQKILQLTEPDAIIVANYYDKIFFPDRLVIKNIDEEREKKLSEIAKLINKGYNVYYYSWQPDIDIDYLNNRFLSKYGIKITEGKNIINEERLFKINKI